MVAVVSMPDFLLGLVFGILAYQVYEDIKHSIKQHGFIEAFKNLWGI